MTFNLRRFLAAATVAALPFTIGMTAAGAAGLSTDRLRADTSTNLADGDQLLVDVRVASVDQNGDATGVRSRTTSSDLADLDDVRTDNRTVNNDEGNDATSARAIIGFEDLRSADDVDSDVNLVTIDRNRDETAPSMSRDPLAAPQDRTTEDERQYREDSDFVFGHQP